MALNEAPAPLSHEDAQQTEIIQHLADAKFHQSFTLPPSTGRRKRAIRVTYCDAGHQQNSDGTPNDAVVLFCGGMFAGRWIGALLDKAALALGVRIISVDRPGMGATPMVDIKDRVQTWLDIVPVLLDHLRIKHVALVSHSAGTVYLLNTMLYLRNILHPTRPYVAMLGPWIHQSDTSSMLSSLTGLAPTAAIGNFHHLTKFAMKNISPTLMPMLAFSSGITAKVGSSLPFFRSAVVPDLPASDDSVSGIVALQNEDDAARKFRSSMILDYVMAENIAGASQEALLCLKRPKNHWGVWENHDKLVPLLAQNEKNRPRSRNAGGKQSNLHVEVFHAENDRLTNKEAGAKWFDECWDVEVRGGVIDYQSHTVLGKDHEGIIEGRVGEGPINDIFTKIAKLFALEEPS